MDKTLRLRSAKAVAETATNITQMLIIEAKAATWRTRRPGALAVAYQDALDRFWRGEHGIKLQEQRERSDFIALGPRVG